MSTTDKAPKTISQEVLDMSKDISASIELKDGQIKVDRAVYLATLEKAGIPEEQVKALQEHNSLFYPAAAHAVGEMAINAFKKDKKLEQVDAEFKMVGRDHYDLHVSRSKEYPLPGSTTGEKITNYGVMRTDMVVQGTNNKAGEMALVRDYLKEKAIKALSV
jgi:hypothetical protein